MTTLERKMMAAASIAGSVASVVLSFWGRPVLGLVPLACALFCVAQICRDDARRR